MILLFTHAESCSKNRFQNLAARAQCVHAVRVDQPHLERPRITCSNDGFLNPHHRSAGALATANRQQTG